MPYDRIDDGRCRQVGGDVADLMEEVGGDVADLMEEGDKIHGTLSRSLCTLRVRQLTPHSCSLHMYYALR
jgi:hypothetical protein